MGNVRFKREVSKPELLYKTIQTIFIAPHIAEPQVTTLILGAWGCGAFGGDPRQIAELFIQALIRDNYGQLYKEIHFAIPKLSPKDENYDVFRAVFNQYKIHVTDVAFNKAL